MEMFWRDLVNSDWHDYLGTHRQEDRLLQPSWVKQMCERWHIGPIPAATEEDIRALHLLRDLLFELIGTLMQGQPLAQEALQALNGYCEQAPTYLQLTRHGQQYQLEQVPYRYDWSWVQGRIAASFASLLVDGDTSRIKQCENPDCHWTYYDESKNRSRRWCEDTCANLMRVRHFRARQHSKTG